MNHGGGEQKGGSGKGMSGMAGGGGMSSKHIRKQAISHSDDLPLF
jgi:hypothetical protein